MSDEPSTSPHALGHSRWAAHTDGVNSAPATQPQGTLDDALLDADTSAAVLRWMETGHAPDGIDPRSWESWLDSGCIAELTADGAVVTSSMLGRWARFGSLR